MTIAATLVACSDEPRPPNVVFFLVDDLGWSDVGFNGSTFYETPQIDALAAAGVQFRHAYAASPVCSPTRASLLTGRHPARLGLTNFVTRKASPGKLREPGSASALANAEVTLAEVLRDAGYATFFAGKWHIGGDGNLPTDQGFDINIGGNRSGAPAGGYYGPWRNPQLRQGRPGEYLTEHLTAASLDFIDTHARGAKPFFVFLSYYNVHTPVHAYTKRFDHFAAKAAGLDGDTPVIDDRRSTARGRQDSAELASMISAVDDSVGEIMARLESLNLDDDTVVVFFSDNGALANGPARPNRTLVGPGSNLPLRAGKGWLYEGGIRVPAIIRAPGHSRGTAVDTPIISMDLFPTVLELLGLPLRPTLHLDGQSVVAALGTDPEQFQGRPLFWHHPHYHGSGWAPGGAVRHGRYKLIELWEYDAIELYDMENDPGERHNLAAERPAIAQRLANDLTEWRARIGAEMPSPSGEAPTR